MPEQGLGGVPAAALGWFRPRGSPCSKVIVLAVGFTAVTMPSAAPLELLNMKMSPTLTVVVESAAMLGKAGTVRIHPWQDEVHPGGSAVTEVGAKATGTLFTAKVWSTLIMVISSECWPLYWVGPSPWPGEMAGSTPIDPAVQLL